MYMVTAVIGTYYNLGTYDRRHLLSPLTKSNSVK